MSPALAGDDADLPVARRVDGHHLHIVGHAAHDQLRQHGQPQPVLHHGDQGGVVQIGVADVGRYFALLGVENGYDVQVKAQRGHQKFRVGKAADGKNPVFHRVVLGQHRHQRVFFHRDPVQSVPQGGMTACKGTVQLTVSDQVMYALVAAHADGDVRVRADFSELRQNCGQPVPGHAGIGSHTQGAGSGLPQVLGADLQPVRRLHKGADVRQQAPPGGGEPHTAFAADQQTDTQFIFQRVHHVRQTRLSIAQLRRGGGKAALVYGGQKCPEFFAVHVNYFTSL